MHLKIKLTIKSLLITFLVIFFTLTNYKAVKAQDISLSISPPLLEVVIMPGKEFKQTYTIQNNGSDKIMRTKIVYFVPSDRFGNVNLTDTEAPSWIKYDKGDFLIKNQEQKTFNVSIFPDSEVNETDHFLTIVFETLESADVLNQNSTFYKTEIGSNILVSVSKDGNPKKSAEIIEFKAPKIIDSIFPITYSVILANNGNSFWKPNGKITINDKESIKLAPLNILSNYSRTISCLTGQDLVECISKQQFNFGKVTSSLEFVIDDDTKVYKSQVTTYAFPFIYLSILIFILTLTYKQFIFKICKSAKK